MGDLPRAKVVQFVTGKPIILPAYDNSAYLASIQAAAKYSYDHRLKIQVFDAFSTSFTYTFDHFIVRPVNVIDQKLHFFTALFSSLTIDYQMGDFMYFSVIRMENI